MLTKKELYRKAYRELENRRLKTRITKENNLKTVMSICPEIEKLNEQLKKTAIKLIKTIFNKSSANLNNMEITFKIKKENLKIQEKIKQLLKINNIPEDFLNPEPTCKICNDYGFVNNKKCCCLENLIKTMSISELQKDACFRLTNFKDFNLNFYSKQKNLNEKVSDYEHMSVVLRMCEKFAVNFPNIGNGLIMYGLTGLGKTHLSLSIASKLISRGFSVLYSTASEIIRRMSDSYFGREQNDSVKILDLINETDLIILDDLGSEFESNFNLTAIFEVINIRTSVKKPIILNTNLDPHELEKRYGPRIYSRIFGRLESLKFVGTDNRHKFYVF